MNEKLNLEHFRNCPNCESSKSISRIDAEDMVTVRGVSFLVPVTYFKCSRCKESFNPMEGDLGLTRALAEYRTRHCIKD